MKFLVELIAFAVVACRVIDGYSKDDTWQIYKLKHGKHYTSLFDGGRQDQMRKKIFLAQSAEIELHNSVNPLFRQELNRFSDMRPSEKAKYLGIKSSMAPSRQFMKSTYRTDLLESRQALPDSLDYRTDICMPPVKNQGSCGSCWAFGAIAPLEFSHCKKHQQTPVVLSEQQLVDCDIMADNGCNGGWYTNAWNYIRFVGGSAHQSIYPYTARRNFCNFWFFMASARVSQHNYVPANDPVAMQVALQKFGPVTVAFAVVNSFFNYKDGVYNDPDCDGQSVNHAVVIVGWGNDAGVDYWIVRNSWGSDWGQSGYIQIQRGVNKCKIETYAAYVVSK